MGKKNLFYGSSHAPSSICECFLENSFSNKAVWCQFFFWMTMEMHKEGRRGSRGRHFPFHTALCSLHGAAGGSQSRQQTCTAEAGTQSKLLDLTEDDTGCHKSAGSNRQGEEIAGDTSQLSWLRFAGAAVWALQGQRLFLRSRTEHVSFYSWQTRTRIRIFFSGASFSSCVFIASFNPDNVADKAGLIWLACK